MADQQPSEHPGTGEASGGGATISIAGWLPIPDDHPTLYANWVQVASTGSETFIDFFLVDPHLQDQALSGKTHFLARVVVHPAARQALLQLLAQNPPA